MAKQSAEEKPERRTYVGAEQFVPRRAGTNALARAAQRCEGCDLFRDATQAVLSRGPVDASIVLVGEQPGDAEDVDGSPFVGPAGQLLERAMHEAGIALNDAYLTNAVKHFKFEQRGKRRIHQRPQRSEVVACRPWLIAEFRNLAPKVVVALGATATSALIGPRFRVIRSRGELLPWPASSDNAADFPSTDGHILATIHPSAVLRATDRTAAYAGLVTDLKVAGAGGAKPLISPPMFGAGVVADAQRSRARRLRLRFDHGIGRF